ncbi:MAG: toxin-antitoxin system YwqK family antitoxin [Verrucomicrobiae bacterium]|nr:toxin-antitoxin system YwqK family antitoxin [Verrucomicrobiae bacterium]
MNPESPISRRGWVVGIAVLAILAALVMGFRERWSRRPSEPGLAEVPRSSLEAREGALWLRNGARPFTGWMVDRHPDGDLLARSQLVDGRLHGASEAWHPNGTLELREFFRGGVAHGPRVRWHSNGQTASSVELVDGQMEGPFRRWHENGVLAEEIPMQRGRASGIARAYYPGGSLKFEAVLDGDHALHLQTWSDGEKPAIAGAATRRSPVAVMDP